MNDHANPNSVSLEESTDMRGTSNSPGAMLRRAREATGIHIAALAVSMKVPVKKLEALEGDRWDLLTDTVFVRALASSMCRALKIDAQPVLEMLPKQDVPQLEAQARGANTPFSSSRIASGPAASGAWVKSPALWVVITLLGGALAILMWPDSLRWSGASIDDINPVPVKALPSSAVETVVTVNNQIEGASNTAITAVPDALLSVPKSQSQTAAGDAFTGGDARAVTDMAAVTQPISEPVKQPVPSVSFHATAPSWVEVTDAKGVVQLRRILNQDERIQVNGVLPMTVVIGRADVVSVEVKGQPFSLASIAKENVARFEVKP